MADLTPTEQTFTQKLGTALFTLLAFLGITSITEVLTALKAAADADDDGARLMLRAQRQAPRAALAAGQAFLGRLQSMVE